MHSFGLKLAIIPLLILSGCAHFGATEREKNFYANGYEPVTSYVGQGYNNGDSTDYFNQDMGELKKGLKEKGKLENAAKQYIEKKYHFKVKPVSMFGYKFGVTVILQTVQTNPVVWFHVSVRDYEGFRYDELNEENENNNYSKTIENYVYTQIESKRFSELNRFLKAFLKEHKELMETNYRIRGMSGAGPVGTTEYGMETSSDSNWFPRAFNKNLYQLYMKDPNRDWSKGAPELKIKPEGLQYTVMFYTKETNKKPSVKIFNELKRGILDDKNLPYGDYFITIYDGWVEKISADGANEDQTSDSLLLINDNQYKVYDEYANLSSPLNR